MDRRLIMMTLRAYTGAAALCVALAGCSHSAESAAPTPSAESFRAEVFAIRIGEATEKVNGALVTSAFFAEAKAQPMVGRLFLDNEYHVEDARVVVIAASLWQRRFGGDPTLIGKALS